MPSPGDDDGHPGRDASSASPGYTIDIGQAYQSSAGVTIAPATASGVYSGYYQAQSDPSAIPSLAVKIHAASGSLAAGTSYPCARSGDADVMDETSVFVQWLDGHSYYTNLMPDPTCSIHLTAVSQAGVSATISGTIFDETDPSYPSYGFTASFVATGS